MQKIAFLIVSVLAVSSLSRFSAAQTAAPVPSQFATAKTAFLAFAGAPVVTDAEREQTRVFYNGIYAALKAQGRYALTSTPEQAELCMEFAFVSNPGFDGFRLSVRDCKLNALLWTLDEYLQPAIRSATQQRNIDTSTSQLIADIDSLAGGDVPRALKAKNQKLP